MTTHMHSCRQTHSFSHNQRAGLVCFDSGVQPGESVRVRRRDKETQRQKEREGMLFFLRVPPCQSWKKATKPIILSSSFFSGAAEASLDCHMYKGSPYKAMNEHAICGAFLFPLLFSSPPFSSLVIKFEQNQMAGGYRESSGGERGFNESTFCWSETSK